MVPVDTLDRPLRSLRLSVTDRCNLRCRYCMPEADYVWLPRDDVLTFEEMSAIVDVFAALGVEKLRVTGGEPLLRRNLPTLISMLAGRAGIRELALTTNGILLSRQADELKAAGLDRVTVSLDTLRADRFRDLTRFDNLPQVLDGIQTASRLFPSGLKLDAVVIRGFNDDEMPALIEYGAAIGAEVRFIEYMDVGGAVRWSGEQVVSRQEILDRLARRFGAVETIASATWAPADRFRLPDGTVFGIIASTTTPFCRTCDRSRLTADGLWYLCLYATRGVDLRAALRGGTPPAGIRALIESSWQTRDDRGAERRLEERERSAFVPLQALRKDPHLEMHTRGG
jgi:cyclic pyranopterin phosphate synthase